MRDLSSPVLDVSRARPRQVPDAYGTSSRFLMSEAGVGHPLLISSLLHAPRLCDTNHWWPIVIC